MECAWELLTFQVLLGSTKRVIEGINGTGMACSIGVPSLNLLYQYLWKLGMGFLVTHTWFRSGD